MKNNYFKKTLILTLLTFILSTLFANEVISNTQTINPETVPVEMISVEKGTFIMGCTRDDEYTLEWEKPIHKVTLEYDFLIGKYELTSEKFPKYLNNSNVASEGIYNEHLIIDMKSEHCLFAFKEREVKLKDFEKANLPLMEGT